MLRANIEVFGGAVWSGRAGMAPTARRTREQVQQQFIAGMLAMPTQEKKRNPADWAISLLVHIVVLAALLIAPFFVTQVIDLSHFQETLLVAPEPPAPPPPPARTQTRTVKVEKTAANPIPQVLTAPQAVPAKIVMVRDSTPPPDLGEGGVPGGIPGGVPGGVLGGIVGGTGTIPKPMPPPPPPVKKILPVGGDVRPPRRIYAPPLQYPLLAQTAKVQGDVVIEAVIDETGHVVQEHVVKGPTLLIQAALAAVKKWRYEPTYLDGQAVSVRMRLTVNFALR